jgi:hypothetical protein
MTARRRATAAPRDRTIDKTQMTPELAAQLLSKQHPRQRRPARQTVALYAREMKTGRWRSEVPDPILIDPDGYMFNGSHRCAAVIASGVTIDVEIRYGADASLFDVIDVGRRRSAFQFITQSNANSRAAAARLMLWYRRRFDHPMSGTAGRNFFDMAEVLEEADRAADDLGEALPLARTVTDYTSIPDSLVAAVFVLAAEDGIAWEAITDFRDGIVGMADLPADDPRRALAERMRRTVHRDRRRSATDDWTLLVRAFNASVNGERLARMEVTQVLPRIGESEANFKKRRNLLSATKNVHRDDLHDERRERRAAAG